MSTRVLEYDSHLEGIIETIAGLLGADYGLSRRAVAVLLAQGDEQLSSLVKSQESEAARILELAERAQAAYNQPLSYVIARRRQQEVDRILTSALTVKVKPAPTFAEKLSRVMMRPATGIPLLIIILYLGLYQFVGVFGAGTAVGFLEGTVFGEWLNPWATEWVVRLVPVVALQDLIVGEYGVITLGLTYAFSIILPIVSTFFIAFSIIEDSGYLPRLAMLIDRVFKLIGLSGRAVIPMVLGFGCDTMATIVTRTQETRRERVITTLLLALAIPCSAQLGVILAILSGNPLSLLIWGIVVGLVLVIVGFLASRVIPGTPASFYMEIPPLRLPRPSNILVKTYSRLHWYFAEVMPIFVLASVLLWAGKLTGVFDVLIRGMVPVVEFIGLPPATAATFLYGFFRRDFGAAGLYDMSSSGTLSGIPLLVAGVTLTLFVPCIAQFSVMIKERGARTAILIAVFIFPFAFGVGYLLNLTLKAMGVSL